MKTTDNVFELLTMVCPKPINLFDKFMEVGVTKVTEKQHEFITIEFILEGDFRDEDIAQLLYKHSPAVFSLVGSTECTIDTDSRPYTARFTRA